MHSWIGRHVHLGPYTCQPSAAVLNFALKLTCFVMNSAMGINYMRTLLKEPNGDFHLTQLWNDQLTAASRTLYTSTLSLILSRNPCKMTKISIEIIYARHRIIISSKQEKKPAYILDHISEKVFIQSTCKLLVKMANMHGHWIIWFHHHPMVAKRGHHKM